MKKLILALTFMFCGFFILNAQVSTYKFEVKQDTYQEIKNPTLVFSGYFYNYVLIEKIPSFKFNGKFYDSLYVASNGYISFGPFKPENSYYPLSQYSFDEGIIAGFANGLISQTSGTPQVAYERIGDELVFEWKDMRRFNMSSTEKINFQIRLNYSDYSIRIVYGVMTPDFYNFNTQQVGIRGNNYNDYLNIEVDSTNNWSNPRIGKSNKAICYFNSDKPGIKPQSGLTYIFTPSKEKNYCLAETNNPFNIEHFGPTNNINVIKEEGNYLWVGTTGGLMKRHKATGQIVAKYDVSNGLPRNKVTDIAIDNQGNKWVSCEIALAKFDGKDWTIYNQKNTQGALDRDIGQLKVDWNGNLWVANFWSGRIAKFDGKDWTVYNSANNGICSGRIHDIEIDPNNNLWIAGDNGFTVFDGKDWKCFDTLNSGIADNYVADIFIQNDTVWFATHGGLSFYTGTSWGILNPFGGSQKTDLNSVVITPNGHIWIGSWGWGAYEYDRTNWKNYNFQNSKLSDNVIGPMLVDGQGSLWLGTYNGLFKYYNENFYPFIQNKEIAGSWVVDILPDKNGDLWFITHEGISKYKQGQWETFKIGLWFGQAEFENDSLLLIISHDGVLNFNINSHVSWQSKLGNKVLLDIKKDNSGKIWFTFEGEGVKVYDPATTSFTTYNTSNSNLPHDIVRGVDVDNSGNLWFATNAGVAKFDGSTWTVFDKSDYGGNNDEILDIGVANNGDIWITPEYYGVSKYDGTNWTRLTKTNGLIDNIVQRIYCEKDTNLVWFCSYEGVSRYDGNAFVNYSNENGLPDKGINDVYKHNDQIWLATQAGASKLEYKKANVDLYANTACYPDKTYLSSTSCYTDPSTKYEWDVNNDGTPDYFSKNIQHAFNTYGKYDVKLSVINGDKKQSFTKEITVGLRPNITLSPNSSLKICDGKTKQLNTSINNYNSQFNYKYYWNTGDSLYSIQVDKDGVYKVRVGIDECFSDWDSLQLNVVKPYSNSEICMVTVDPTTKKNLVIWERDGGQAISSFNIYKLYGSSYTAIGNKAFNDLSVFIDQTTDPTVSAARYALTVIDTCGNESPKSPFHQTIHLGASEGTSQNTAVLDWTDYVDESGKFVPDWYYIYKGSSPNNISLHDSISSAFTEWNDNNATGTVYYQVTVEKPDMCYPSIIRAQTLSGPYNQSYSNLKDYGQSQQDYLQVSPNYQIVGNWTGASATYNVFTNADSFAVECSEDWVSISKNELAKFFIVTTNSEATENRTANISIKTLDITPINVQFVQSYSSEVKGLEFENSISVSPNPFRDNFRFAYELSKNAKVNIQVLDQFGRLVKIISDENQMPGNYIFTSENWNINFDDGLYILKIQMDDQVVLKKLVKI